jgi:hypothetical protein
LRLQTEPSHVPLPKKTKSVPAVKAVDISGTPIMPLTINCYQAVALVGCDVKTIDRAIAAKKSCTARRPRPSELRKPCRSHGVKTPLVE